MQLIKTHTFSQRCLFTLHVATSLSDGSLHVEPYLTLSRCLLLSHVFVITSSNSSKHAFLLSNQAKVMFAPLVASQAYVNLVLTPLHVSQAHIKTPCMHAISLHLSSYLSHAHMSNHLLYINALQLISVHSYVMSGCPRHNGLVVYAHGSILLKAFPYLTPC